MDSDPTELRHAERVRRVLLAYGLDTAVDMPFILSVIDGHGLFHPPNPEPKQRSKDIRRAAKAAAKRFERRILQIRAGKQMAVDDRERRLAENWERLGPVALYMEEEKIRCGTYQTMRGGRIVPIGEHASRRPELELTHALLMIDYHLEHGKQWSHARRMSCLTGIVIVVQDLHEDVPIVAARVRERLREARTNESLEIWRDEYLHALSAFVVTEEMHEMRARLQQFHIKITNSI